MTVDQILQAGLDEALKQYVTRNFHVWMSEGSHKDGKALSRCMTGIQKALEAYSEATVAVDDLLEDEAERASKRSGGQGGGVV